MLHIPILRRGRPYRSLDTVRLRDYRKGATVAEVSQANPGLIRRDLLDQFSMRASLEGLPASDLFDLSARAADAFMNATLPIGEDGQSPGDYVVQTSSTTGLPHVMVRRNMKKIEWVLSRSRDVVAGLTRGLDPGLLDTGRGRQEGRFLSFVPLTSALGVVLPSNSPGVHALWAPALALKTPLVLKPGSAEPWTPHRIVRGFLAAGAPAEAFGFYPAGHEGAAAILRCTGRSLLFGDAGSIRRYARDPRIEVHGPGFSKVVLGEDASQGFERYLDPIIESILDNGGRSCVNTSSVWVCGRGKAIANALADRLAAIGPRAADDPKAEIAPFPEPAVAESISAAIDRDLQVPGASDLTAKRRGPRLVRWEGSRYLLPTIVHCDTAGHPLANREFLFPFASVVEVRAEELPGVLGPTLALMVVTEDEPLRRRIFASPLIRRLHLGAVPTTQVAWDQPHEGNLFEHIYARRAFDTAS